MSKYRILKVTYENGKIRYYAQKKVLFFWMYIIGGGLFFTGPNKRFSYPDGDSGLESAEREIEMHKYLTSNGTKSYINY